MILLIILIFLLLLGGDQVYIKSLEEGCKNKSFVECMIDMWTEDEETIGETVTATGVLSGTYGGKARSVNISLTIPLGG